MQKRYLYKADTDGYFAIPSRLTRFSMDVGFNIGAIMVGDWLMNRKSGETTFMIGVEANPFLHTLFDTVITERPWPRGYEGMYWQPVNGSQAVSNARHFRRHADQLLLVHAAAASTINGVADFHLGIGWNNQVVSDVGSLFPFVWERNKPVDLASGNIRSVATLRLDELLARVPPPPRLQWDTLKIDIQGAERHALPPRRARAVPVAPRPRLTVSTLAAHRRGHGCHQGRPRPPAVL